MIGESNVDSQALKKEIEWLKKEKGAVVLAHYYQLPEIQDVADHIGDSLALAQIAAKLDAELIVMCGVHFMGETAKILCPGKKVLVPSPEAGCSLASSCPAEEFKAFVEAHPGHTVISYVNTSAEVKALTDVLVTSGNAKKIIDTFPKDEKIIFGPDKNLGSYINKVTGRDMLLWDGACHVHEKFSLEGIAKLKQEHPQAHVLVHPECPQPLHAVADKVGSTAVLLRHAVESDCQVFIVATEPGILHEMRKKCPGKTFIAAPAHIECNECEHMKLNTLEKLRDCLRDEAPEIIVDEAVAEKARKPIERMLQLS